MHGRTYAEADKPIAIAPDSKTKITYMKTPDGKSWIQNTVDTGTGKQLPNYVKEKGRMKG
jgi:hypothetical protein